MKKFLRISGYVLFLLIAVLFLLEICFRYQVIDFYSTEWKSLNKDVTVHSGKQQKKMLVFGDSYSASAFSYINVLRDSFPEYEIYNASIPGTGIRQVALIAQKRIREINPDIIIYQIYVGNDLTDIQHPVNWSKLSFARNSYWWLSDRFLVLHYLNYASGQFDSHKIADVNKADSVFSIARYNSREKIYIQSDPFLFENAITLNGKDSALMNELIEKSKNVFAEYLEKKQIYFVILPEDVQVNNKYYDNKKMLGCNFRNSFTDLNQHYTFLERFKTEFENQVIDPLPFLQENDSMATYYFANDPHLTPTGQSKLGQFLVGELKEKLK